jgi:transmembrane sensor
MKYSPMEWDKERLTTLTIKYLNGELTVTEQLELDQWLDAFPGNRERFEERIKLENVVKGMAILDAARERKEAVKAAVDWTSSGRGKAGSESIPMNRRRWARMVAAAAVILLVVATFLMRNGLRQDKKDSVGTEIADLPPGGNKAILTLANGSTVVLDSAKNGLIAHQGHSAVVKKSNGQLLYKEEGSPAAVGYNTIVTPRGGEYQVTLPDGTRVWLNAGSSVKFPTSFSGDRREVEMTGEAYFEVAHQEKLPFIVHAGERQIEDIGTHFNVNAYPDEPEMKTTLIEGAVRIKNVVLRPGQQLGLDSSGRERMVSNADIEEAMAWKNGLFVFNGADIETVMRSIERWYDVSVVYEAGKDSHRFTGQISRTSKASEALDILATSGYHFKIRGKIITVLP